MKKFIKAILSVLFHLVFFTALFAAYLTVQEYKPADLEKMNIYGAKSTRLNTEVDYRFATWNIGYGALGDNADFFMDGGKMVNTATEERVVYNLDGICDVIDQLDPDFLFFQELDISSSRSYFIDEKQYISDNCESRIVDRQYVFAPNFSVSFLPYPIPPIGKVYSGLLTFSKYSITDAERYQLPCPFKWPSRVANIKRCLLVTRHSIAGSDKELVFINLHLEAYDDGEGKVEQTNMLKGIMADEVAKGNYVIAVGDFNQVFSTTDTSRYPNIDAPWEPGFIDVNEFDPDLSFYTDPSVPTGRSLDRVLITAENKDPEHFQYYMLDGVIASSNVVIKDISTIDLGFKYSDHNPVYVEFYLEK